MIYRKFLVVALAMQVIRSEDCIPRSFSTGIVCVCNATYCDTIPQPLETLEKGTYQLFLSDKAGNRFKSFLGQFSTIATHENVITVNRSETYQRIMGWGGAFTDSTGINVLKLSKPTQDQLISTYYGPKGSRYNMGRIPIGGTDFSTRAYTLDDMANDDSLKNFSLTKEDYQYKIPLILKAKELKPDMQLFGTSWTAPAWMKTNNKYNGFGFLKDQYYQTYADYLLAFLRAYKKHDIDLWALTTGNEPSNAFMIGSALNTMGWTPKTLAQWVAKHLGPSLANSEFNQMKIIAIDDQRYMLPWFLDDAYNLVPEAKKYIDGVGVHWYWDSFISPKRLDEEHEHRPDKFILMTEACSGANFLAFLKVRLGSWKRAQELILDIIENMRHWVQGWIDWNLALDIKGGPNYIHNNVDASIIVIPENDEFYKQPLYYAMSHISGFVPVNSVRIESTEAPSISSVAFKTPSDQIVVVLCNTWFTSQRLTIQDTESGIINLELPEYSISTVIYK